jgi:hypothetical protein
MKRGIWPIAHTRDKSVLERIYVTIFDVARIVSLVADQMLPENRQRVEKSQSPGGRFQMACR